MQYSDRRAERATLTLGPEGREPVSFRLEGEGETFLPLLEAAARHMPITVRFWRGSSAEHGLLSLCGLSDADVETDPLHPHMGRLSLAPQSE